MRKVYIRVLLLLVILIQCPVIFCSDEGGDKLEFSNEIFYVSKEGVLKIKNKNKLPSEVIVPEKVNNKVVLDVDFSDCENLISVILPNSLTKIGNKAFKNCKSLHSIFIPESLTYVAKDSFEDSGLNIIYTSYGDKNRIESMLPNYKEIIEELPF